MTVSVSHTTAAAPEQYTVESHATPGLFYTVWPFFGLGGRCTCPDYQHRGGPCKHIRQCRAEAALLVAALADGLTIAQDGSRLEPEPTLTTAEINAILFGVEVA